MALTLTGFTLAVIIGALLAIIYVLRILFILEKRVARMEADIERVTTKILREEFNIERAVTKKKAKKKKIRK